jgi:hypothetical protein
VDPRVGPFSFEEQNTIRRVASTLQVPSQDVPRSFGQSSPFTQPVGNLGLITQELEQTQRSLQPPSVPYLTSLPEQFNQPPAILPEGLALYNFTPPAAMYDPTSSCLRDKVFGFARTSQWSECFAGFIPIGQSLTNHPGQSK